METSVHTEKQQHPKREKFLLFLLFFMTIATSVFAWLYWIQKNEIQGVTAENIQITAESETVKRDLQQLQAEYNSLETDNTELQKQIDEKKALIEQLQEQAEKHKNDVYIITKLKKETQTLRQIMQQFVREIDSLNTLNRKLIAEKDSVSSQLTSEKEKSATLHAEKEKLYKIGSALKAKNITVKMYDVRGKDRQSETTKAKKTNKIQISFVIEENKIAPAGNRTIYVRIVTPDGKEWTESADADHMFSFGNSKGFYAAKKNILYDNQETEVILSIKKKENDEMLPGKYLVEINMDNAIAGSANIELE